MEDGPYHYQWSCFSYSNTAPVPTIPFRPVFMGTLYQFAIPTGQLRPGLTDTGRILNSIMLTMSWCSIARTLDNIAMRAWRQRLLADSLNHDDIKLLYLSSIC